MQLSNPDRPAEKVVRLIHHLALHLSKYTPLHRAATALALAEHISRITEIGFEPCPALDPNRDPPICWLERMQSALPGPMRYPSHDGINAVGRLLRRKDPYEAEVPLRAVVGVTASKGELPMSLDSLPETMWLSTGEGFGPLDARQAARLRIAVMKEFSSSSRDGVFHLDLQEWDGAYIAANSGASRRFALWRRLSNREIEPVRIKAVVTPYELDAEALNVLRNRFRLVYCSDNGLLGSFVTIEQLVPNTFAFAGHLGASTGCLFLVPYTHQLPSRLAEAMGRLHRRIDEAGALDVGRFLTEQISVACRRTAAFPGSINSNSTK